MPSAALLLSTSLRVCPNQTLALVHGLLTFHLAMAFSQTKYLPTEACLLILYLIARNESILSQFALLCVNCEGGEEGPKKPTRHYTRDYAKFKNNLKLQQTANSTRCERWVPLGR